MKDGHIDEELDRRGAEYLSEEARRHAAECARCGRASEAACAAQLALAARRPVAVPRGFAAAVTARLQIAAPGLFERAWSASRPLVYAFAAACLALLIVTLEDRDSGLQQSGSIAELWEDADAILD